MKHSARAQTRRRTRHPLRARAEEALRGLQPDISALSAADLRRQIHELEVHQIELGMQNEELREAQVELANSRDRLADLYDFAPVGYVTLDPEAVIVEVNQTAATLLGVRQKDLIGRKFTHWLAPEVQDTFYLHRRAVFSAEKKQTCELLLRKADGPCFPARVETICITDPATGTRCSRSTISDISEGKRTQEALRESEERFRTLAAGTFEGVAIVEDGRLVEVNEQLAQMLGYPPGELLGMEVAALVAPQWRDRILANIKAGKENDLEHALLRKDGTHCFVEAHGRSITYQGRPARITALRDITEQRRLESELRQANIRLEERVTERTAELTVANEQLRREVTAHRQLQQEVLAISEAEQRRLGAEVHDGLCAQLAALRFANETLHKQLLRTSPPAAVQTARVGRLLADTLAQARNLALMLNPVEVEAEGLMMALATLASGAQQLYQPSVRFACPRPVLVSDHSVANHLFRIAQEAVRNAVTHGKPSRITIGLSQKDGTLKLTVANNGRPFPKAPRAGGGMGLRNLHYRAEAIDARLDIRRRPHGGTLLVCSWPIADTEVRNPKSEAPSK